jgi:hypothetical protein
MARPASEFLGPAVVLRDGKVREWSTAVVRVLGPLAGAQAGIGGPLKTGEAVSAALSPWSGNRGGGRPRSPETKPFAHVAFPEGTLHQTPLGDKEIAAQAQADVLRFNTLAEAARKRTIR